MDGTGATPERPAVEIRPGVLVCPDAQAVAREAAVRCVELSQEFITKEDCFSVALAGGNTPRELYRLLASDEFRSQVEWSRVHIFWGDERPVPPDDPQSNYGMAYRELLSHVPIPPENIHRMEAEQPDLVCTAKSYEKILHSHLSIDSTGFPRFHLILLGLGPEGHIASLFPPTKDLLNTREWVAAPFVKKLRSRRITLTLPVLNAAYHVLFLVTGSQKAEILRRVIEGSSGEPLPAELVKPVNGERVFLADRAAASALLQRSA